MSLATSQNAIEVRERILERTVLASSAFLVEISIARVVPFVKHGEGFLSDKSETHRRVQNSEMIPQESK